MNLRIWILFIIAVCVIFLGKNGHAETEEYHVSLCVLKETPSEIVNSKYLNIVPNFTTLDVEQLIDSMTNVLCCEFDAKIDYPHNIQFQVGKKKYKISITLFLAHHGSVSVDYCIQTNDKRFFPLISASGPACVVKTNGEYVIYPLVSAQEGSRGYILFSCLSGADQKKELAESVEVKPGNLLKASQYSRQAGWKLGED